MRDAINVTISTILYLSKYPNFVCESKRSFTITAADDTRAAAKAFKIKALRIFVARNPLNHGILYIYWKKDFNIYTKVCYMMSIVDIIIEIPYNSFVKYEYDKKEKKMRCDRVLHTAMAYPGNYGYIPNTLSGDGDPLDVLMICEYPIYPGTIVQARIIGVLFTKDEKGDDEKILAVPACSVDPNYSSINNYSDLPEWTLSKIQHFFKHYKDTENNKWVTVKEFKGKEEAMEVYQKAICLNNLTHSE